MTQTEDLLAATVRDQKVHLETVCGEIRRAHEALDSAGHPTLRGGSEELGDGICKLAGERDQLKAQLDAIAKAVGISPDPKSGYVNVIRCTLHLVAKAHEQRLALIQADAGRRALENALGEKNARILELQRECGSLERHLSGVLA